MLKAGFSFWLGCRWRCSAASDRPRARFPALRVQTIYLAFATLGFNTAVGW